MSGKREFIHQMICFQIFALKISMTRNIFVQDTLAVPEWELMPFKKMSLIFTFILFSFTVSNVNWGKSLGKDSLSHHPHSFKPEVLRGCLI